MELIIPRYLAPGRRLIGGLIPPSPPAEQRDRWKAFLRRYLPTHTGRLPQTQADFAVQGLINGGLVNEGHAMANAGIIRVGNPLGSMKDAVAYWKQENLNDSTGRGHTLTDNGSVTFSTGKLVNAAYMASATQQWESIADNADFNFSATNFAIVQWYYLISNAAQCSTFCKGYVVGSTTDLEYRALSNAGSGWFFTVGHSGSNTSTTAAQGTAATWHLLYCDFDGVNININVDNGASTNSAAATNPQHTALDLLIGREGRAAFPNYMDGRIDTTGMWKRVLTSTELGLLWNNGNGADVF